MRGFSIFLDSCKMGLKDYTYWSFCQAVNNSQGVDVVVGDIFKGLAGGNDSCDWLPCCCEGEGEVEKCIRGEEEEDGKHHFEMRTNWPKVE